MIKTVFLGEGSYANYEAKQLKRADQKNLAEYGQIDQNMIKCNNGSSGKLSAKIEVVSEGRNYRFNDTHLDVLTCRGGVAYLIGCTCRKIIAEVNKLVLINCSDIGEIVGKEVKIVQSKYRSIVCDNLTLADNKVHDVDVRNNMKILLPFNNKELIFENCMLRQPLSSRVPKIIFENTKCLKFIQFEQVEGTVVLRKSSRINEKVIDGIVQKEQMDEFEDLKLSEKWQKRLLDLPNALKKKVIGQDYAIQMVSSSVRRALLGYGDPNKPLSVLLFAGKTGTGKTQLVKALVDELQNLLGLENFRFIRFDMGEYQQDYMVAQLIGSPLGYQDHEKGGLLTNFLKVKLPDEKKGVKVLLLDEFEKMHYKSRLFFLSLLDEGRVTDSDGNVIDAKNVIIIATTNLGSGRIADFEMGEDFSLNDAKGQEKTLEALKPLFCSEMSPELFARFQRVIFFNSLSSDIFKQVVLLKLSQFKEEIQKKRNIEVHWKESLLTFLLEKSGTLKSNGVRGIENILCNDLRDLLADSEIHGKINPGDKVNLYVSEEEIKVKKMRKKSLESEKQEAADDSHAGLKEKGPRSRGS